LVGDSVVGSVTITGECAVVAPATRVADSARNDEVLTYAQLGCTPTDLPQIAR